MHRYTIEQTLGEHAYGLIMKAVNNDTKERVIIKMHKRKFYTWEECMSLREIKVLRVFNHPGVQRLKELIREKDTLYSVYEWCEQNLFEYYQDLRDKGQSITETEIKNIMHQLFSVSAYIHKMGYMHRDLCLENILVNDDQVVKLGNFFTTREIAAKPPLTDYVTTRWYRAPEQLLHSNAYTFKIDMWALGCIMAELYLLGPLFGGQSESDQLYRIVKTLGTPKDWPEFYSLLNNMKAKMPEFPQKSLASIIPNASREAIDLIQKLLLFNPQKRLTAAQCLKHAFFTGQKVQSGYSSPKNINSPRSAGDPDARDGNAAGQEKEANLSKDRSRDQDSHTRAIEEEEESHQSSSPKSQNAVPDNVMNMKFERPVSRDCNRHQISQAKEIKDRKQLEDAIQHTQGTQSDSDDDDEGAEQSPSAAREEDEKKDTVAQITINPAVRKSVGAVFQMSSLHKPLLDTANDIAGATKSPEGTSPRTQSGVPGMNFMFKRGSVSLQGSTPKSDGTSPIIFSSNSAPTNAAHVLKKDQAGEAQKHGRPPQTPDQPPGLDLDRIVNSGGK